MQGMRYFGWQLPCSHMLTTPASTASLHFCCNHCTSCGIQGCLEPAVKGPMMQGFQYLRKFNDIVEPTTLSSMNWYMSVIFYKLCGLSAINQARKSSHYLLISKPQSLGREISRSVLDRVHSQSKNCRQGLPPNVQPISQTCSIQSV